MQANAASAPPSPMLQGNDDREVGETTQLFRPVGADGRPARLAGAAVSLRTIQEWLGHEDSKTTQIYAHYAPSEHEVSSSTTPPRPPRPAGLGYKLGYKLSETDAHPHAQTPANSGLAGSNTLVPSRALKRPAQAAQR